MKAPKVILTDIEGTTSSIDFVHDVLFPYAREALPRYLRQHREDDAVAPLLDDIRQAIEQPDADLDSLIDTLVHWIDEDRKAAPLKKLQGFVWEHGYRNGDFIGHIYEDAARRLRQWHERGIELYVYSSGSVKAQRLLFGHSSAGDLTPLFDGYFDTDIGHKKDARSYQAIAGRLGRAPADMLFLSDVIAELDAAAASGMRTLQLVRDPGMERGNHPFAHDFDQIIF